MIVSVQATEARPAVPVVDVPVAGLLNAPNDGVGVGDGTGVGVGDGTGVGDAPGVGDGSGVGVVQGDVAHFGAPGFRIQQIQYTSD